MVENAGQAGTEAEITQEMIDQIYERVCAQSGHLWGETGPSTLVRVVCEEALMAYLDLHETEAQ